MSSTLLLILTGLFFYWIFKSYGRYQRTYASTGAQVTPERLRNSELGLFVALMAKVAKADGRVDTLEAELIGNTFTDIAASFPGASGVREELKAIFNEAKARRFDVDTVAMQLYAVTANRPQERLGMFMFLVNLAFIDGVLSPEEEALLNKIAVYLKIDASQVSSLFERFAQMHNAAPARQSIEEACAVLGVGVSDSMEVVKKKYRALVKKYHPDLMKAKGADEAYIAEATQKMQAINAAYETIKEARKAH